MTDLDDMTHPIGRKHKEMDVDSETEHPCISKLSARDARMFACDCAERVSAIMLSERPDDRRFEGFILESRRLADGTATGEEAGRNCCDAIGFEWDYKSKWARKATDAVTECAHINQNAWDAAEGAARAAIRAVGLYAIKDARADEKLIYKVCSDAEKRWQADHLNEYLKQED